MFRRSAFEMRVVIFALIGRDASLIAGTLESAGIDSVIVTDGDSLLAELKQGMAAAIVADEALQDDHIQQLKVWLAAQPPWSDPPFIVLTTQGRPSNETRVRALRLDALGNYTMIERPARPETIETSVRACLRARMRQYEIRSRQESLIQANADLEQFAHSASHDLREPLRTIGIYSELLAAIPGIAQDERVPQYTETIRRGAKRMEALLEDLLSYAHASSIPDARPDATGARTALDAAIGNLNAAITESQARITVGAMPDVRIRESHLTQVFQNLLGNAIKYRRSNDPPNINVGAGRVNGSFVFSVADDGIGIAPNYSETIFGIFRRLHNSEQYTGTGMGLAICKRIVERYRGRIWVESEEGHGSTFFFTIPS
jgi:signal transduction histidine kinase